jgi:hypothetical protein
MGIRRGVDKAMIDHHLTDEEIQARLDGDPIEPGRSLHLERCSSCGARAEGQRALLLRLDRLPRFEPSPDLEDAVCARLFPRPAMRGFRVPAWAGAFAPILLLIGSALFYSLARNAGVLADLAFRWLARSDAPLLRFGAEKLRDLIDRIPSATQSLVDLASVADALSRAAILAWSAPEVRLLLMASTGVLVLLAMGWGARMLLTRTKGGHHHVLLA